MPGAEARLEHWHSVGFETGRRALAAMSLTTGNIRRGGRRRCLPGGARAAEAASLADVRGALRDLRDARLDALTTAIV